MITELYEVVEDGELKDDDYVYFEDYIEDDELNEIALCTLAAFNLGAIEYHEIPFIAKVATRALDNLLDYQDYPVSQAHKAKLRRSLGIGVTSFAYFLAKNYTNYNEEEAKALTHKWFECMQYSLLDASADLAAERGACGMFSDTTYSDNILPVDRYNKNVDKLVEPRYYKDWEKLRSKISEFGLRHSTLSALMPCESSSQVTNSTNGIEPPRALVSTKGSKDGVFNQVVPEIDVLYDEYQTLWEMVKEKGNRGYLSLVAIMQKFVDQSVSVNTNADPTNYPDGKVPMKELIADLAFTSHYGIKTLYYHNTRDGADGSEEHKEEKETDLDCCSV